MTEELMVCTAAYFRSIGKDVSTTEEFIMGTSLELKWMAPSDSKLLLAALVKTGTMTQKDGFIRPSVDPGSVDVPLAYRPSKELLELVRNKCQTPAMRAEADQTEDPFPMLMELAVGAGMQRRDFIQSCNKIQKRLDIEVTVAGLIVLRDSGVDVSPYLDVVYGSIRI